MSMSQLEPGELPSTPPTKSLKLHPTPDKMDNTYTISNRKRSRMYADKLKSPVKVRSKYIDRSPTPPFRNDRKSVNHGKRRSRSPKRRRSPPPRRRSSPRPPHRRSPKPPKPQEQPPTTSFSNWVDLRKTQASKPATSAPTESGKRGVNASRVKGLEKANTALKENIEFFKQSSQAHSYKYELMKVKAQEELTRRHESDRKCAELQAENSWLKGLLSFPNFGHQRPGPFGMPPVSSFQYKPDVAVPPVKEKSSIESIELPKALKVRARSPAK